ncbi:MAG: G5 domain-containing protein [Candidatus Saccharimonadales bacterium]
MRHVKAAKIASRHPFAVPVFVVFTLIILALAGYLIFKPDQTNQPPPRLVIINYDHLQQIVPSIEPTVGKLLSKLNIKLNQGDVVEPSLSTVINQDDFRINIYRAVPVEITENGNNSFTFSAAATPRAIAEQAGYNLNPADVVTTVPTADFIKQGAIGEQVIIDPATPVNLNLYGSPVVVYTFARTVADLMKVENIHLEANDQVLPSLSAPITPDMQVFLVRNGEQLASLTQTIPLPVDTIYDNSLAYGTSAVQQSGSSGQEEVTYQENTQNGAVVSKTLIQTVVTVPAVTEIILVGTNLSGIKGDMAYAGIAPSDYSYADYIISHESGWCPTKAQGETYCPGVPDNPMTPYGYGLCQATPGYKMASAGSDWETNPITQLRWCNGYAISKYGSWYNAYSHWTEYGWW